MEKIYVDQQQNQKKKKKSLNSLNVSLGLSFAVAFVAIASILFVSLSGKSYALDDETSSTIHTNSISSWVVPDNYSSAGIHSAAPVFTAGSPAVDVYCLESGVAYSPDTDLTKDATRDLDPGLVYMNLAFKKLQVNDASIKRWLQQTAIWVYMARIGDEGSAADLDPAAYYSKVSAVKQVCVSSTNPSGGACTANLPATAGSPLYEQYGVGAIIDKAVQYHNTGVSSLGLVINKAGSSFTLTEDGKSYKSPKITVELKGTESDLSSLKNFKLALKGAPEGTYLQGVTATGEVKIVKETDELQLSTYKEFYAIVPKDKVTEATKKFTVVGTPLFSIYGGYYYVADDAQSVTTVEEDYDSPDTGIELEVVYTPDVPDTALNASRSIYLIGLIVLLSGLGILYVNVKKQQKQN